MFDIGFLELVIISIVGLLVLGPERLPGAIRTVTLYLNKIRRSFNSMKAEVERELRADEIRQELHNQTIMQQLKDAEKELRKGLGHDDDMKIGKDGYPIAEPSAGKEEPSAEKEEPSAEKEEPSAEKEEPSAEKEEPSAEKEEPLAEKEEPSAEKEEPSAEKKEPSAEKEEAAAKEAPHTNEPDRSASNS